MGMGMNMVMVRGGTGESHGVETLGVNVPDADDHSTRDLGARALRQSPLLRM